MLNAWRSLISSHVEVYASQLLNQASYLTRAEELMEAVRVYWEALRAKGLELLWTARDLYLFIHLSKCFKRL